MIIKADFSDRGKALYRMKKDRRVEQATPTTEQKIRVLLDKQRMAEEVPHVKIQNAL